MGRGALALRLHMVRLPRGGHLLLATHALQLRHVLGDLAPARRRGAAASH